MSNNDLFSIVENQPGQDWLRLRVTRYSLLGVLGGILFPIIASIVQISVKGLPITLVNLGQEQLSDPLLWIIDSAPLFLGLLAGIAGRRQDLVLQANKKLTEREAELNSIRANLEQGILNQTRELDERNAQMRSVVAFARQVADIHDIELLLPASVAMIAERFARRDARLFLLNESGQWAMLKAASSPAGRDQLKDGFRVRGWRREPCGSRGKTGQVAGCAGAIERGGVRCFGIDENSPRRRIGPAACGARQADRGSGCSIAGIAADRAEGDRDAPTARRSTGCIHRKRPAG